MRVCSDVDDSFVDELMIINLVVLLFVCNFILLAVKINLRTVSKNLNFLCHYHHQKIQNYQLDFHHLIKHNLDYWVIDRLDGQVI